MSGISNIIIAFYDGTENGADVIRNRLKQHAGDYELKIICNRGSDRSFLDLVEKFYEYVEQISVDEWNYDDVNNIIESIVSNYTNAEREKIIELTMGNQVEVSVACRMSYVYGVKVYCGNMKGENKMISAPRVVDVTRLGRIKKAILEVVNDGNDYTISDIHIKIKDEKIQNYRELSQKHVRTNVDVLLSDGLLETNGRVMSESNKKRTVYHITEKGRVSMTIYKQSLSQNKGVQAR